MARKKEGDAPADIPIWFVTFSDVITLLMTFFILLLTFATSEPEQFERLQIAMFGGGGTQGLAGLSDPSEKDTVLLRERPRAGRVSLRGSEMPPIHADPSCQSLAAGLAGLEENERRELSTQHAIFVPLNLIFTSDGAISSLGYQQLRMLAKFMRKQQLDVDFLVARDKDLERARLLASRLFEVESIQPGRLGIGRDTRIEEPSLLKIVLTRPVYESPHGSQDET
jgi:hypothetical protein